MNTAEIISLTRAARTVGIGTLLELSICAEILHRGECSILSLSNTHGVSVEAVAHACARMEKHATRTVVCREAVGFSMARLTESAEKAFRQILRTPAQEPLRKKNLRLRYT